MLLLQLFVVFISANLASCASTPACLQTWNDVKLHLNSLLEIRGDSAEANELLSLMDPLLRSKDVEEMLGQYSRALKSRKSDISLLVKRFARKVANKPYDGYEQSTAIHNNSFLLSAQVLMDLDEILPKLDTCHASALLARVILTQIQLKAQNNQVYHVKFNSFLSNVLHLILSSKEPNCRISEAEVTKLKSLKEVLDKRRKSWFGRKHYVVLIVFFIIVLILVVMSIMFEWTKSEKERDAEEGKKSKDIRKSAIRIK